MIEKIRQINKEVMEGTDDHLKDILWIFWFGVRYSDRLILKQSGGKDETKTK